MKWQYLGKNDLHEGEVGQHGYTYHASLWRTPVPGGWLVLTMNSRSNDPQPMISFYPDAEHLWNPDDQDAATLLRPSGT